MKHVYLCIAVPVFAALCIFGIISQAGAETSSCQGFIGGKMTNCQTFSGNLLSPLDRICSMAPNNKWLAGKPCPKENTLGECRVPRNDKISQIVYCYRSTGTQDKEKISYCKQACGEGVLTAYK